MMPCESALPPSSSHRSSCRPSPGSAPWIRLGAGGSLRVGFVAALLLLVGCGQGADLEQPTPLYGEAPIDYPIGLWDEGVEGTTLLRLRVSETGEVDSVEVVETSGHLGLDSAAVAGARDLRFQPGRRNGKRVRMWASLPVHFSTRPRSSEER
ncbi:MAG: energy transducer TonB [Gemmatimonadales bacterium]|nr:MAG: energy transducer TonB [Gemmatimonadales bacterium]